MFPYQNYRLYKSNKFKIIGPTWNEKFELLDKSDSISNIQNYFELIVSSET